ncbi:MAG TPA: response regulator [Candidatus Thermoplasmatota archaeon]|nr:response regulator [Candidatus Thermoplasmatota archaeon]
MTHVGRSGFVLQSDGRRLAQAAAEGPTILIVDDDLDVLLPLSDALRNLIPGARIYPAESGAEALQYLCDHPVDLVVTDYRMPGLSGIDLVKILRRAKKSPPVILMTGHPSAGLAYRATHETHFSALLAKPFDAEVLAAKAIELLSQAQARSPRDP